jgi:hypothetical protein
MKDSFKKFAGRFLPELKVNIGKSSNAQAAPEGSAVKLTSLAGAPNSVGGLFSVSANTLTSLDGVMGITAGERAQREEAHRQTIAQAVEANTVLQHAVRVSKPLTFRGAA